ncbi:zinc finger protein 292b isoform X2 [Genypterus blacodes]|uniref:zinc finger protein 292b isoform X2 n=1 Tax=Genypterus blacodes TaxID=154954 RepID=UPI003F770D4C
MCFVCVGLCIIIIIVIIISIHDRLDQSWGTFFLSRAVLMLPSARRGHTKLSVGHNFCRRGALRNLRSNLPVVGRIAGRIARRIGRAKLRPERAGSARGPEVPHPCFRSTTVEDFLLLEGPVLLEMRVKQLMKEKELEKAALLAKICSESPAFQGTGAFKQMLLVCLCATLQQQQLMDQLSDVDCRDALEMICNLESDEDDGAAFSLCSAFLTRQLLHADSYCAWELTLFWSKLLKRLEPSEQTFLDRCRQMSLLSKTVYHILFFIKVIQSEMDSVGLPVCIEMCIRALQMEPSDGNTKATVCKTISCLLPTDLEVKRACQLTEFLVEPTVDSYYAVETLYNEPDQKLEEENMPAPNSLRCELLLVFKTLWSFDPEFWDWKTLKRHCLALMGEEASIVSSIDLLNDTDCPEEEEEKEKDTSHHSADCTYELNEITDKRQKNREMKKLREKGFISARFRNWQAYMQYCVLCDKEFLGHRIVRHAQTHFKDGAYNCPICAETFASKETLVPHVASHVKQSCKERLTAMKTNKKLAGPKGATLLTVAMNARTEHPLLHAERAGSPGRGGAVTQTFLSKDTGSHTGNTEENMCPVGNCKKSFKFFKNLVAHVKAHGDVEEAKRFLEMQRKKVVCQYCRRHFVNVTHLNDHLQVHCGVKPYICIQLNCKASFLSNTELFLHKKEHAVFKARCMFPSCAKIFNEAYKLYDHEAQHYRTFTCQVPDCGKLFHSQSQLELHQEEHAAQTEEKPEHALSLMEQMLSDPPALTQKSPPDSNTCKSDSAAQSESERSTENTESLLNSSAPEAFGQDAVKQPLCLSQAQRSDHSVIQSVSSHSSDPLMLGDTSRPRSLGSLTPAKHNQPIPPSSANVGVSQTCVPNVLQGHTHMLACDRGSGSMSYSSDCNVPLPEQLQAMYSSNLSRAAPPQETIATAMSQPLPPTAAPLQLAGNRPENAVAPSGSAGPPAGERERYHCAVETCTRHYSCYRSVTKHMKTVHPDFYEHWKLARTPIKTSHPAAESSSSNPTPPCSRGTVQTPSYTNMLPTSSFTTTPSVPSSGQRQNAPLLMENVLNPIVLSQLGGSETHSQAAGTLNWNPACGKEQTLNCGSTQVFPSNLHSLPPLDVSMGALERRVSSCSMMGSSISAAGEQMQPPPSPGSALPSLIDGPDEPPEVPLYTSQMQSNSVRRSELPENFKSAQHLVQPAQPSSSQRSSSNPSEIHALNPEIGSENPKRVRKSRRTKWPAILKDGKFVCCRCFRKFDSPKSLGGHLSKRSSCKTLEDVELNADLPESFLDLLNSEPKGGNSQTQLSFSPAAVYPEKLYQTGTSGSTVPKEYTTANYPQANMAAYVKLESNDDILQQIMAESNMSDLFVAPPFTQSLFQSSCAPFGAAERLPGSSVIRHTENVHVKREDDAYAKGRYPQPRVHHFAAHGFSDPLLSQILTENSSAHDPSDRGDVFGVDYCSGTIAQTADSESDPLKQMLLADTPLSPASSRRTETPQGRRGEHDVKKRLREQILAGDFQRRNSFCFTGNTDPNAALKSPLSSGPLYASRLHQTSQPAKAGTAAAVIQTVSPSTEVEGLPNTHSFTCFRQTSVPQQEVLIPVGIVSHDVDPGPALSSTSQQPWMMEIQSAFERLDLVREIPETTSTSIRTNMDNVQSESVCVKGSLPPSVLAFVKPFACESEKCTFTSMSSESLWKHLSKTHNYTLEMVNCVKKRYGLYAPYQCQKCSKTFTRNSNLRAHYLSAHKLSLEEVADLDLKRKSAKAAATSAAILNHSRSTNAGPAPPTVPGSRSDAGAEKHDIILASSEQIHHRVHQRNGSAAALCSRVTSINHQAPGSAAKAQSFTLASQCPETKRVSDAWQRPQSKMSNPFHSKVSALLTQAVPPPSAERPPGVNKQAAGKMSSDGTKKMKEKKGDTGDAFSPYRPYRCVHQGCVAAFTIQHNLILHYRAVHQSALSALEVNKELERADGSDESRDHEDEEADDVAQVSEFRCQEKDCSRVFQEVANLLQHYLQLHEFCLDKAGALLSSIDLGRFACGHQECQASFTAVWKYIGHVKEQHKDIKLSKAEAGNSVFQCNVDGCDRSYATKSNLLRHAMKKHHDVQQPKLRKQHRMEDGMKHTKNNLYQISKTSNGKENIESNKKISRRGSETKRIPKTKRNYWTTYGRPSLKCKEEAAAMCTKKFPLQYPCMIKGCDSVMSSERNITRHYMGHGLSEKYLEEQRSRFIFCKKFPSKRYSSTRSNDSKSDNASDLSENEFTAETGLEGSALGSSKPALRKRTAKGFDSKQSNDESSEPDSVAVGKRKRGRPRKLIEKIVKRKKIPRSTKSHVVYSRDDESDSSCPAFLQEELNEHSVPLASFKPMGFEMSFLKFLEQSNKCEYPVTKKAEPSGAARKTPAGSCGRQTCVQFSNRQNVKSLSKVKIVVDATCSGTTKLMMKQLQEMRPTVMLEKKK